MLQGHDAYAKRIYFRIKEIIIACLLSVWGIDEPTRPRAFELFGFDCMVRRFSCVSCSTAHVRAQVGESLNVWAAAVTLPASQQSRAGVCFLRVWGDSEKFSNRMTRPRAVLLCVYAY